MSFPLRLLTKSDAWYAVLVAAMLAVGGLAWSGLPARVPIHWGIDGQPNGWGSALTSILVLPLLAVGLWVIMLIVPAVDPYRENILSSRVAYGRLRLALAAFFGVLQAAILAAGSGYAVPVAKVTMAAMAALFAVIAETLPHLKRNFTVGLRLPWTIVSEEVWNATHRHAKTTFLVAALLIAAGTLFAPPLGFLVLLVVLLFAIGETSYFAWRLERRRHAR